MAADYLHDALVLDADDTNTAIETAQIDTAGIDTLTFSVVIRLPGTGTHKLTLYGSSESNANRMEVLPFSKFEAFGASLFTIGSNGALNRASSSADSTLHVVYKDLPRYVWLEWDPGAALVTSGFCKVAVFGNRKAG